MNRFFVLTLLCGASIFPSLAHAQSSEGGAQPADGDVEEILVTARRQDESIIQAPVTITVVTGKALDTYNLTSVQEISTKVPNLVVYKAASGTNAGIFLRGVGSSSESAAFEQSVAINIDGVTSNVGRLIFGSYFDLKQVEVVKGPQSLYFGKSATAGVISLTSRDPTDDPEFMVQLGHEFEYDQDHVEVLASTPITSNLKVRLAGFYQDSPKLYESILPRTPAAGSTVRSANKYFGEESLAGRLTLLWTPTNDITARLKALHSRYRSDGAIAGFENICVDGTGRPQNSRRAGRVFTNIDDCKINGTTSVGDVNPAYLVKFPLANKSDGKPYLNDDTTLVSLFLEFNLPNNLNLTTVTGYLDGHQQQMETTDFTTNGTGPQGFDHYNDVITQELRLASSWDGRFNFLAGVFYQHAEQKFYSSQNAVNIALTAGPDPVTGNSFDWQKNQFVVGEVYSAFFAGYLDLFGDLKLSGGVRYTDETKDGMFTIPYMHSLLRAPAFLPSGTVLDGLKFSDNNWSPELTLKWEPSPNVNAYVSYKTGFKSGGIDNSALPSSTLTPTNPDFPQFLIFKSERAKGGEAGLKMRTLGGALKFTSSVFQYYYKDLQVQQLIATGVFQFKTFNASEVRTRGVELEADWNTPVDGLSLRGGAFYTDTRYTEDFFDIRGDNLKGLRLALNAPYTGYAGVDYRGDLSSSGDASYSLSVDARYSDGYPLENRKLRLSQDSFVTLNAAASVTVGNWQLAVVGRNLTNELYLFSAQDRVGAVGGPNGLDRVATVSRGREVSASLSWRY